MYKNADFVKLGLRVTNQGSYIWLNALKATAAYYGWDEAFPTLAELRQQDTGSLFVSDPGRRGWKTGGGREIRISRSSKTHGWPAGLTNAFRVSSDATVRDLAEIAKATEVDWEWMTGFNGARRSRGWWLEPQRSIGQVTRKAQATG